MRNQEHSYSKTPEGSDDRGALYTNVYTPNVSEFRDRAMERTVHWVRDLLSADYLKAALSQELGLGFGGYIVNLPARVQAQMRADGKIKDVPFQPGDLDVVLQPIRPAMDDRDSAEVASAKGQNRKDQDLSKAKRYTERSGLEIERQIFAALRPIIEICDRERVFIGVDLPDEAADWEWAFFTIYSGASIKQRGRRHRHRSAKSGRTVGYLVSLPSVPPHGFRLVLAFGVGGTEGYLWSQLLAGDWRDLLIDVATSPQPRLVMASFQVPMEVPLPLLRYETLDLEPELLANVVIDVETGTAHKVSAGRQGSGSDGPEGSGPDGSDSGDEKKARSRGALPKHGKAPRKLRRSLDGNDRATG